jgi:hypothetical protein
MILENVDAGGGVPVPIDRGKAGCIQALVAAL